MEENNKVTTEVVSPLVLIETKNSRNLDPELELTNLKQETAITKITRDLMSIEQGLLLRENPLLTFI
ncbi:hypothetical protein F8M41_005014 [Gigaspora margarita]|uniref:Uncharacterized protein n=1 Tax=Gigaspora margarita TaxID=4874 RepID=A0A8H3X9H8_GIGMA|nr:hypothetical protein F8M41_005014 [Gigaspora margarita]